MIAEHFSASLVSRPLMGQQQTLQGYYRSKLFVVPLSTNPLVAAAGPVLSLLERLCVSPTLPPVNTIRDNIEHELKAFHSRILGITNLQELEILAYYMLCATVDEMLGKSFLRLYGKTIEFSAFTPASHDGIGPEQRFFDIVNYIKQRPNQFLDLLELAYYCLITGFEGIYHGKTDGRQVLDNLLEELYQLIQQYRVNKSHNLFKEKKKAEPITKNNRPLFAIGFISIGLLVAGYLLSYSMLINKAKSVQLGHQIIAKLDD